MSVRIKTFSATKYEERNRLGDAVTDWLEDQGDAFQVKNIEVRQSSDEAFHCLTIVVIGEDA